MPGIRGDDPNLRRKVLADLVASRARGGMRSIPRSTPGGRVGKVKKISDVAQAGKRNG